MCPSRPPGVVDCYTLEGMCARDAECTPLVLAAMECITDTGFMMTPECQEAQSRLHGYLMRRGMSANCTCITSPAQCRKFRTAIGMPEEVSIANMSCFEVHLKAGLMSMPMQHGLVGPDFIC